MSFKAAWELTLWILKNFDLVCIIIGIADLALIHTYSTSASIILIAVGIAIRLLRIFKTRKKS